MRDRISLIGLAISVVAVAGVVYWASKQESPRLPSEPGQIAWLLGAIAGYAVNTFIRAERWHRLLKHDGATPHFSDSLALTVIGYAVNNVLPARAGDAARVVLMAPRAQTGRRTVVGTLLAERLLDIAVIFLLFVVVGYGILGNASNGDLEGIAIATVVLVAGLVAAVLVIRRNERLRGLVMPVLSSTLSLRGAHGGRMLAATLLVWLVETLVWMMVGASVGFDMSLLEGLYLVALSSVFAMIPSGPAYAGTQDTAVVVGIKAIGGSSRTAFSYLLMLRFVLIVPITLAGFILLAARYGGLAKLRRTRLEATA